MNEGSYLSIWPVGTAALVIHIPIDRHSGNPRCETRLVGFLHGRID
jgi:hypothetical protein